MKTAEVALEYILAGLLGLCAFALPFARLLGIDVSLGANGALDTGAIVGVLGVAYLLGVVFDRAADTLLSPFENELRIRTAVKQLERRGWKVAGDPFPVDRLLYRLREDAGGNYEWLQSLRSRIRTARELAVLGLPAVLGIAVHLLPCRAVSGPSTVSHSAVAFNLILIVAAAAVFQTGWCKAPKTYDLVHENSVEEVLSGAKRSRRMRGIFYFLLLYSSFVGIAAVPVDYCVQSKVAFPLSVPVGIVGTSMALLAYMVWWRITKTYMKFVAQKLDDLRHPAS